LKNVRTIRGQAVVEFAIIVPVLFALVGATTDFARLYASWISVHSATRAAAEYLATNPDKDVTSANAGTIAAAIINDEVSGLGAFGSVTTLTCAGAEVQVAYTSDPDAAGASDQYPLGRAVVGTCAPFRTLFNYPFITKNGAWVLSATASYEVLQNRR
jgi:Flp pilus assembly protein TadG